MQFSTRILLLSLSFLPALSLGGNARMTVLGPSAVAARSASNLSLTPGIANPLPARYSFGMDYLRSEARISSGGLADTIGKKQSSYRLYGMIPLSKLSGAKNFSGLRVGVNQENISLRDKGFLRGDSVDVDYRRRELEIAAHADLKVFDVGVSMSRSFFGLSSDSRSSFSSSIDIDSSEGGFELTTLKMGVGKNFRESSRLAFSFQPIARARYAQQTDIVSYSFSTEQTSSGSRDFDSVFVDAATADLGFSTAAPELGMQVTAGIRRDFPYGESQDSSAGQTTVGIAGEYTKLKRLSPRLGLQRSANVIGNTMQISGGLGVHLNEFAIDSAITYSTGQTEFSESIPMDQNGWSGVFGVETAI